MIEKRFSDDKSIDFGLEEVQFFKCESIKGRDTLYTILKRLKGDGV